MLTGFWVDAALPTPFGLVTLLMLTIGSLILLIRLRFRAEKNFHPSLLAHIANLITGATLFYFSISASLSDFFILLSTSFIELVASHLALLLSLLGSLIFSAHFFQFLKQKQNLNLYPSFK